VNEATQKLITNRCDESMQWLWFCIDLVVGKFSVPISKINMLKSRLLEAKQTKFLPAKQVASNVV